MFSKLGWYTTISSLKFRQYQYFYLKKKLIKKKFDLFKKIHIKSNSVKYFFVFLVFWKEPLDKNNYNIKVKSINPSLHSESKTVV